MGNARPARRPWTNSEDAYLTEHYPGDPPESVAAALGRSQSSVCQRASALGVPSVRPRGRRSTSRSTYFDRIDRPVQAYSLGLLLSRAHATGDGRILLELHERDREAVELVRDEVAPDAMVGAYVTSRGGPVARLEIRNAGLAAAVGRYGLAPGGRTGTRWPADLPVRLAGSFLLGCFDGKGQLNADEPRWVLASGGRGLLKDAQERIYDALGFIPDGPYASKRDVSYTITVTGHGPVRQLDEWTHQDMPGLARKRLS